LTVAQLELFMTTHTSGCLNPAGNLVRPRSWLKFSFRNQETDAEIGRLIFRTFQCAMELDYILPADCLLSQ